MTEPPRPRRSRRRLKRAALFGVVGLVAFILVWLGAREWDRAAGEREVAAARTAADGSDPDWTWERLNAARPRPPAGKNSAELIPQIKQRLAPDWTKSLYEKGEAIPRVALVPPYVRYHSAVLADVRRDLAASGEAVALARTLKDYPFGHRAVALTANVLDTPHGGTDWTRHAADVLRWDAVIAVEDRDPRRAADDLLAMLAAARSIGDEPHYQSQLVRGAVRIYTARGTERMLAQTAEAVELAALQSALAAEAEEPLLLYALRGQRAQTHELFENLRTGRADFDALTVPEPVAWKRSWRSFKYRADRASDHARALDYLNRYVEVARQPLEKQTAGIEKLPSTYADPDRLISFFAVTKPEHFHGHVRGAALVRCAVVGVACERFRLDGGDWPDTLDALIPTHLAAVPLDPFTGRTLRYEKSESGVVVFAAGRTGFEDGGTHADVDPPGNSRPRFRLWNPELRRQPPAPEPPPPELDP